MGFKKKTSVGVFSMFFLALSLGCTNKSDFVNKGASVEGGMASGKQPLSFVKLENPGFEAEEIEPQGASKGWDIGQHAGIDSYTFTLDRDIYHGGRQSLCIKNIGPEVYGVVQQPIETKTLLGKKVELSAWLKTDSVDETGAGLTLRAMVSGGGIIDYNFMQDSLVRGSQDWKLYRITLQIPEHAKTLEVGVMLQGKGTVWADDFELKVIQ